MLSAGNESVSVCGWKINRDVVDAAGGELAVQTGTVDVYGRQWNKSHPSILDKQ